MKTLRSFLFMLFISGQGIHANAIQSHKTPEERLEELNVILWTPNPPIANFVNAVRSGNLIYISGKGPELPDGGILQGKVGIELSVSEGKNAARVTAIALLSVLKHEIGELSRVRKIVKLNGMVNSSSDFIQHPEVINGASDLLVQAFGEPIGKHARAAVGMNSLPFNIPVEIDMIVEIAD